MFTRQARQRRAFFEARIDTEGRRILEFGALDNPTFHQELGDDVAYLDYFSHDELRANLAGNPNRHPERIGFVDHVVKTKHFAQEVDSQFDLIVANHVLEHIADPITWFQSANSLLSADGWVILALPDRRYTFDYYRPETAATSMIRAHDEDLEQPSVWQILEGIYYHTRVDLQALWKGEPAPPFSPRWPLEEAQQRAGRLARGYADTHCWVFTRESFERLVADLQSAQLMDFRLAHIEGPVENTNEFYVYLQKQ